MVAVGRRVAHQEVGRLERAHHAVGGHAQEPRLLGHLVDGPLTVVHVEEVEDGETAGQRTHQEGIAFDGVAPVLVALARIALVCGHERRVGQVGDLVGSRFLDWCHGPPCHALVLSRSRVEAVFCIKPCFGRADCLRYWRCYQTIS